MATTALAGLPIPDNTDDAAVPADLLALAEALEPFLNLKFTSASDRDTKWPAAPNGSMAWLSDIQRMTVKRNGAWEVLAPTVSSGTGAPPASGTDGDVYVKVAG